MKASTADKLRAEEGFDLAAVDTNATPGFSGKKADGRKLLANDGEKLAELQERLFAAGLSVREDVERGLTPSTPVVHSPGFTNEITPPHSVLLVLQGMDTSGKGGIVKHVVGEVNPQGVHHHAFAAPTPAELKHSFLWRVRRQLPEPGIIGVFDRSHYEDVLVARVRKLAPAAEIESRYKKINDFERKIVETGTKIIKVMLDISPEEQKERLTSRLEDPTKYWKYSPQDLEDRSKWTEFQKAYQIAIERTSTHYAPWYVVPADRKWYARIAVQHLLIGALEEINPQWPEADFDVKKERKRLSKM